MILDASYTNEMFETLKANTQIKSTKRLYELISACPPDRTTDPPGPESFTRALIDTLTDLADTYGSRPFSTAQINQRIRMSENRKGNPSQLWSLFTNERHIAFSPMKGKEVTQKTVPWPLAPPRSYLKLGLTFRDDRLNKEQIGLLTQGLAKALKNKRILGLRKIDWLGIEIRPAVQHEQTNWARTAIARWKMAVKRKREERKFQERRSKDLDPVIVTRNRPFSTSL